MGRIFGGSLAAVLGLMLSGCAALGPLSPLRPLEQSLVFQPTSARGSLPQEGDAEEVSFKTEDDVLLHGRFFDHATPRAVVLYCHGNAGSVATWSATARQLRDRHQVAVFLFDYRGYGQSQGSPSESGILLDGEAARRWLLERTRLRSSDLVIMGRSLGGAVAVDLAVNGGARFLVLESTFSSLPDVVAYHVPWAFPHLMMTQRLNSAAKITSYRSPLLQSHGDADSLIPLASARKLFDAAEGPKRFIVVRGANHDDPSSDDAWRAFDEYLVRTAPRS